MNIMKFITAALAVLMLPVAAIDALELGENNSLHSRMLAATDARDAENPAFEEALSAGNFEALAMLGQIGGSACQKLLPYLRAEDKQARKWAAKGAEFCQDGSLSPHLLAQLEQQPLAESGPLAHALGFSGKAGAKEALTALLNSDGLPAETEAAVLFGLLQSVAYERTNAADMGGQRGMLRLLDIARDSDSAENSYAAAYVLARLQAVPDVLPYTLFEPGFLQIQQPRKNERTLAGARLETARLMVRIAREYGDSASLILQLALESPQPSIRHEAIRSLGYLEGADSKSILLKLADTEDESNGDGNGPDVGPGVGPGVGANAVRHLALDALGQRSGTDPALVPLLEQFISDDNRWVATTALRWLGQRDAVAANEIAADWLAGEDYYLAFQALIALTGSDDGKTILQAYADAHPDTVRGFEAAVALDPSLEAITKPRKSPPPALIASYAGRELVLETTRGMVCITMTEGAPYAATSFLQLADVGKMDGMLWHRVIPNFVSQAGQIENKEIANWGSIREEWGGEHRIGSVGVATAGRDTGTTQFFINTGYNMHLNGRYTVFGNVTKGMDVVYALEEGDIITKAFTTKDAGAHCK